MDRSVSVRRDSSVRDFGPCTESGGRPGGDFGDDDDLARPGGLADHRLDPPVNEIACHHEELLIAQTGDGRVGGDPAVGVQPLRVDQSAHLAIDHADRQPVENTRRVGPCTMNLAIRLMSRTPTSSRMARCSRPTSSKDACRAKSSVVAGWVPSVSCHSANSQPTEELKCRRRLPAGHGHRAPHVPGGAGFHVGHTASPNRTPSCSTVRSLRNRRDDSCRATLSIA